MIIRSMTTTIVMFLMAGWNGLKSAISIVATVRAVLRRLHPGLGCREEEARVAAAYIDPTWKLLLGFLASPQKQPLSGPATCGCLPIFATVLCVLSLCSEAWADCRLLCGCTEGGLRISSWLPDARELSNIT